MSDDPGYRVMIDNGTRYVPEADHVAIADRLTLQRDRLAHELVQALTERSTLGLEMAEIEYRSSVLHVARFLERTAERMQLQEMPPMVVRERVTDSAEILREADAKLRASLSGISRAHNPSKERD